VVAKELQIRHPWNYLFKLVRPDRDSRTASVALAL
jgi:hypothetical protein